ncbi:hypothetical protein Tco_0276928 [Tanacetum coccineum]
MFYCCGSLNHLIKDYDYYEKKMAREAEVKRVVNIGNGEAKPVWTNANRTNHANQFVPRSIQLNAGGTAKFKSQKTSNESKKGFSKSYSSVRRPFENSTTQMANSNAVMGSRGSAVKTSASYNWRNTRPNFNYNSGPTLIRTVNAKGPQGRPKPAKAWVKDQLEDFEEFNEDRYLWSRQSNISVKINPMSKELGYKNGCLNIDYLSDVYELIFPVSFGESSEPICRTSSTFFHQFKERWEDSIADILEDIELKIQALEKSWKKLPKHLGNSPEHNTTHLIDEEVYKSSKKGRIFISQDKNVAEILKKFDLVNVKAAITPMETKMPLPKMKEAFDVDDTLTDLMIRFPRFKGSFSISKANPTWGFMVILGNHLYWKHSHDNIVDFKSIAWNYGFNFMNTKSTLKESTICIMKNPVYHSKTKHIEIRHHFIRDCYEKKLISVEKIHTDLNVADLLTKPFDGPRFNYLVVSIGLAWMQRRSAKSGSEIVNTGFAEIMDFLRGSNLRQTATANTNAEGTLEIKATIDTIRYTISEASIRDSLQLDDATGITMLPNEELFEGMGQTGGFRGAPRPLLPSMLLVATNPNAGQAHDAVAPSQPSSSTPPVPSTSSPPAVTTPPPITTPTPTPPPIPTPTPPPIPTPTPPPIPTPTPPPIPSPTQIPDTEPTPFEHTYEESSPVHQHFSPPQEQAPSQMPMDDLLQAVPKLISRIDSLEMDLKQTKLTMGNAIVKLEEEPEVQGRKSQDDPLASSVQGLVTPPTTKVHASGEEQVEDISPNTLEAAKTLSKVASLKTRSIDKGRRYKRRKESKGKKVVSSLDFQEEVVAGAEQVNTASVNTASGDNTGSIKLNTGDAQLSTVSAKKSTSDQDKGQREGKAPMISEETPKKAKLEANAELSKSMLGSEAQGEDFAKKMNQGTWKLTQLKKLSFEEVKEEFDKLVKQSFRQRLSQKDERKIRWIEANDDESTKKSGKRRSRCKEREVAIECSRGTSFFSQTMAGMEKSITVEDFEFEE